MPFSPLRRRCWRAAVLIVIATLALPCRAAAQAAPLPADAAQTELRDLRPGGQRTADQRPGTTAAEQDGATDAGVNLGVARALDAMIERAHSLIGTPYRNGGSAPDTGFDCSGLAGYLYRDILGFQLPRSAQQIWKFGKTVEREDLRPGDLVFYNTLKRPYSHVGIYLGGNRFIHSPTSGGRVHIVDMNQRYWVTRWNGAKRVVP